MVRRLIVGVVILLLVAGSVPVPAQAATLDELQMSLSQLQLLLLSLLNHPAPVVKGASTIVVTNDAELVAAIKGSTGGETIQLAPGNYSFIQIVGGAYNQLIVGSSKTAKGVPTLAAPVTITSQDPAHPAVIPSIAIRATNHWHLKGLSIRPVKAQLPTAAAIYMIEGIDNTFEDSTLTYGDATGWTAADWVAKSGDGVIIGGDSNVVRNNTIQNVYMGISMYNTATHALIKNNTIDGIGGDGIQMLSNNVTVDGNVLKNFKKINSNGDDCMQSWGTATGSISQEVVVKGVTVQNNLCLNNESAGDPLYDIGLQGFDALDSSMQGWTVKNNVFIGTASNGMVYAGAVNMNLQNNTILDGDAGIGGADNVLLRVTANRSGTIQPTGNTFKNNLSNKFPGYGSSSVTTNNIVVKMADYDKYFRDWRHGDVRLLSTSPIKSVGANIDPASIGYHVPTTAPVVVTPIADLNLSFSADVERVLVGESVTLTWNASAVTECTASGGWNGSKDTSGSEVIDTTELRGLVQFSLRCSGAAGAVSQNINIPVSVSDAQVKQKAPKPSVTLTAAPMTFPVGASTVLSWSSTNATVCTAGGGWSGEKEASSSETVSGDTSVGSLMYSLTCSGSGGRVSKNVVVMVTEATGDQIVPDQLIETPAVSDPALSPTTDPVSSVQSGASTTALLKTPGTITMSEPLVVVLIPVNVRATPNGEIVGQQSIGTFGVLGSEPDVTLTGTTWVYVDFRLGADGYVAKQSVKIIPPHSLIQAQLPASTSVATPAQSSLSDLILRVAVLQKILAKRIAGQ